MRNQIIQGDALEELRKMPDHSVDAICSDPPSGISFMGAKWDSDKGGRDAWIAWLAEIFTEARRVLKPGGHALVWSLPRTSHWTAYALEDAGFEIRDSIEHVFGSGMPKSHNISVAIDKMYGAEREIVGERMQQGNGGSPRASSHYLNMGEDKTIDGRNTAYAQAYVEKGTFPITAPATPEAQQYAGYGSALKPAHETWWLARAPLAESSIAANVLKWGVGGLNIDACRIGNESTIRPASQPFSTNGVRNDNGRIAPGKLEISGSTSGRFPANFLLSHSLFCTEELCDESCPVRLLDLQSGIRSAGHYPRSRTPNTIYGNGGGTNIITGYNDEKTETGGASRYFQTFYYCPKPSKAEKSKGCDELPERIGPVMNDRCVNCGKGRLDGRRIGPCCDNPEYEHTAPAGNVRNHHPTVKSTSLMKYLITMVTPPGGLVLDPFMGSGSTGVACAMNGFGFIGIEREAEYVEIAKARIAYARSSYGKTDNNISDCPDDSPLQQMQIHERGVCDVQE